jgi:hypothetical protein
MVKSQGATANQAETRSKGEGGERTRLRARAGGKSGLRIRAKLKYDAFMNVYVC